MAVYGNCSILNWASRTAAGQENVIPDFKKIFIFHEIIDFTRVKSIQTVGIFQSQNFNTHE